MLIISELRVWIVLAGSGSSGIAHENRHGFLQFRQSMDRFRWGMAMRSWKWALVRDGAGAEMDEGGLPFVNLVLK